MKYEWKSATLKLVCKAWRHEPLMDKNGEEEFHLKSLMAETINARGHGKTLEEAKRDLEINIGSLYPVEKN